MSEMIFYKCELESLAICKNRVYVSSANKAICVEIGAGSCVYCKKLIEIKDDK